MRKEIKILGAIVVVVIIAAMVGANYYRNSIQSERVTTGSNSNKPKINPEQLVRSDSPTLGSADAKVTVVEFYDPECESCAAFSPIVKKILKEYEGKIRFVVRYMPLHPNSLSAATFTEAAGEQGKYWQAQEMLFQKQPEWGTKHGPSAGAPADINALFKKYAAELGLDKNKMDAAHFEKIEIHAVENFQAVMGKGAKADCVVCYDKHHCIGKLPFISEEHDVQDEIVKMVEALQLDGKTSIVISNHGGVEGIIALTDEIKTESKAVVAELKSLGVATIMLTGDNHAPALSVAKEVGITEVKAELLPEHKADAIKELLQKYGATAMV